MNALRRLPVLLLTALTACGTAPPAPAPSPPPYPLVEADIAGLHAALRAGRVNCREVVRGYLDRIAAYDRDGPALRSVITLNPGVLDQAGDLDRRFAASGLQGPLHCVTVMVKDNFDTADMPTTAGARAFAANRPPRDAVAVARLRDAGALILGKANMDEFAFTYKGSSSMAGQVRNPYDPAITPGGSSSGTAAAVAASLAMVGLGTDTGGSGRVPAAVQGLVGLRPSQGLLSQDGIVPLAHTEDTAAPMCRTVQDCAVVLDVLAAGAPAAGSPAAGSPAAYAAALDPDGLRGARIGVVRQLFPAADMGEKALFDAALERALARMREAGAAVEDVVIDDFDLMLATYETVKPYEFKGDLERYLQSWPSDVDHHLRSYAAMQASGLYEERNRAPIADYARKGSDIGSNPVYLKNVTGRRPYVRERLLRALDHRDGAGVSRGAPYDVLIYPTRAGLNIGADGKSSINTRSSRLSSFSGFPALAMPVAMVLPPPAGGVQAPVQPLGLEMLAREFDEARLLRLAFSWQSVAAPRRAPALTPELAPRKAAGDGGR